MPENITGTTGFTAGPLRKPSSKDSGSTVFNTLETFMTRIGAHTHDGVDSELINRTVSKSEYKKPAASGNWSAADATTGNKYIDVTITTTSHKANNDAAGSDAGNATYSFWYYADSIVAGTPAQGPGWVQFHPEVSWTSHGVMRVNTNISATIAAAAGTAQIRLQAF